MPAEGPRAPAALQSAPSSAAHAPTSAQLIRIDAISADLLRAGYRALGRGDERALASLLHERVEWRGVRRGVLRRRALCRGRDEVVEAFRLMIAEGRLGNPNRWTLHDVLMAGDLAAVTFSWGTASATTIHLAHVVQLGSGQIIAIQDYATHTKAVRRLRGRGPSA